MKLSQKDSKYLLAALVLLAIAGIAVGMFASQEVSRSKNSSLKVASDREYALGKDENVEVLEMERAGGFDRERAVKEVAIKNKAQAIGVIEEMEDIINTLEQENSVLLEDFE